VTYATEDFHLVLLDLHAAAAAVTPLPTLQFAIELCNFNGQTRGQAFDYRDQRATV
jgi:hypothetical protein